MIRVFIIDDRLTYTGAIETALDSEPNIEVVGVTSDGYQAIAKIEVLQPDLVLVNLEMSDISGLEIIRLVRLVCQQNYDIKVLVLSDRDRHDLASEVINAGAKDYLPKDLAPQEIVKAIRFACRQNAGKISTINNNYLSLTNTLPKGQSIQRRLEYPIAEAVANERASQNFSRPKEFDFSYLLKVFKRRYPPALIGFSAVLLGAVLYLIFAQRNYQAVALISLEDRRESVSELGKDLSSIAGSNEYSPLANQARLIKSMPVINSAINNLTQEQNADLLQQISPDDISSNLNISVIPNTNILEVSYLNSQPKTAALILNEVIDTVIAKNTDTIRSQASTVRQFLSQKVNEQSKELKQLETSENLYRAQNGIVNLDNQTANLVNSLNSLENQEQDLFAQIKEQEAKANNFKQLAKVDNSKAAYSVGTVTQDRQLENLRTQLTKIESEVAAARSKFTNNHPVVVDLQERKAEILNLYQQQVSKTLGEGATLTSRFTANRSSQQKDGINQEVLSQLIAVENQLEADRNKLQAIQLEKEKLSDRINALPAKVQSLTELVRQRQQADENLQFLQRKLEEARITEAQLLSNIQIVEPARMPSAPHSPRTPLVLAVASLTGTIFATGIILLLEKIDRTIYDGTEIEKQLDIPFLATLPNLADGDSQVDLSKPYSVDEEYYLYSLDRIKLFLQDKKLYEPYRTLLKRLESTTQYKLQTVVITSAIAREGKSVVAAHLGAVSAMLNRRTLIIDAHLNQPSQHNLLGVSHQPGLAEIVTDGFPLEKVIQSTELANLSVLPAGDLICNSCAVVESAALEILIQQAKTQYDLVIIDAPSVSSNGDAQTLANYGDGLVMVTRPLHTKIDILKHHVVELKKNQAPIIGFVIDNAGQQERSTGDRQDRNYKQSLLPRARDRHNDRQHTQGVS